MVDLRQMDLYRWQLDNFGDPGKERALYRCALGMAEEVGETCHAILKGLQGIREGAMDGIDKDLVADGVCDTLIYGIQILSELGLNAEKCVEDTIAHVLRRTGRRTPRPASDSTNCYLVTD
jgi:NTP pyrophosphatase (non-canonical NTP hydrolase)